MARTLADNLKRLMSEQGLSQKRLAERTRGAVSQRTISNMLAGKPATHVHMEAVARALKVPLWRLLVDEGADVVRLVDAYSAADPEGRDLIQNLIKRLVGLANKGNTRGTE